MRIEPRRNRNGLDHDGFGLGWFRFAYQRLQHGTVYLDPLNSFIAL